MRLYLVDSSIFVFRAWYGPQRDRVNRQRQPNQAFVGFSDFVFRLLTEQAPQRLVFAFDESLSKSSRKELYPAYKANRSPAPQELRRQFAWCRQWLEALGITCVSSRHWEADDLIGSLVNYHRSAQLPVAILTADKDLAQLISERDVWWSYLDGKKLDYRAIHKKFGVRPEQIADQLALTGDKVDNIPGIPRIGLKTAARLLRKYDSVDNLRQYLDQVGEMKFRYASHVQRSLIEHEAQLDISLQLTRINREISEMQQVDISRQGADAKQLQCMMREQAFGPARTSRWLAYLQTAAAEAG